MKNIMLAVAVAVLAALSAVPVQAQGGGNHRFFDRLDANGDGSLTKEEIRKQFPKFSDENFKQADRNGDGKLSLDEWRGFAKEARSRYQQGRGLM